MTGREKIERICGNFHCLTGEEGDYIRDLSRVLYEVDVSAPAAETLEPVLDRPGKARSGRRLHQEISTP